jgi:hypothetical protein
MVQRNVWVQLELECRVICLSAGSHHDSGALGRILLWVGSYLGEDQWRCEKVEESWLLVVGKLRLLPKSGDLGNPNNWRGITLLAVIAKLFCSARVLSNRMTSHMQVIGLEAQCGFMPGKSTVGAIFKKFTMRRVSLQKRFRFQKDTWVLFVDHDFVKAFDTVPREMLFKVLARLGFPARIINLVRVFHENVTLELDLARHPGFQPKLPPNGPLLSPQGRHHPHHEQLAPR